jgi:hypothetical protein
MQSNRVIYNRVSIYKKAVRKFSMEMNANEIDYLFVISRSSLRRDTNVRPKRGSGEGVRGLEEE